MNKVKVTIKKDETERKVGERYVKPMEILTELRKLEVSPSEAAERYVLEGLGQVLRPGSMEMSKEYVSRVLGSSIRRLKETDIRAVGLGPARRQGRNWTENAENEGSEKIENESKQEDRLLLKMDPLSKVSENYGEWLKESLVRHFGRMVGCDREVIRSLAEQMNQFLSVSRATSVEETASMKRISDILLEENVIVRMENKGLYETGKLSNAEVIHFPNVLLRLRESVLTLSRERAPMGGMEWMGLGSLSWVRKHSKPTWGEKRDEEQEQEEFFYGEIGDQSLFEKKKNLFFKEDSGSELRAHLEDLNMYLEGQTQRLEPWIGERRPFLDLSYRFGSAVAFISREYYNIEQVNMILDTCLRVVFKSESMSLLSQIIEELVKLRRIVGDEFLVEIGSLLWNRLQILTLASHFELLAFDNQEQTNLLRKIPLSVDTFGLSLFKHVVFLGIPLFGCNILQFSLVSDSRVFNNVIQEDLVRSRVELFLQSPEASPEPSSTPGCLSSNKTEILAMKKFDTSLKGGRETRSTGVGAGTGLLLVLEFCDNRVNIYESRQSSGGSLELRSAKDLQKSFFGDYLVELVTFAEIHGAESIQSCVSILVNGEVLHTLRFGKSLDGILNLQVTMMDETALEIQSSRILSKSLVNEILLKHGIIDNFTGETEETFEDAESKKEKCFEKEPCLAKSGIGALLIFLSSVWRSRVARSPGAASELRMTDFGRGPGGLGYSDYLGRLLRILKEELDIISGKSLGSERSGALIPDPDVHLVLNLVFILKHAVAGDESLLSSFGRSPRSKESSSLCPVGNMISPHLEKTFEIVLRLMTLELAQRLVGFQWLLRITAISTLSQMSLEVVETIFQSISIEKIEVFLKGIMNSKRNEINEILDLIQYLVVSGVFKLIITRLLRNKGNQDESSNFFVLLKELIKRNTEFCSTRDSEKGSHVESSQVPEAPTDLLSQNLTDWLRTQIETERKNCHLLDQMYIQYDLFKNRCENRILNPQLPNFRFNCDNRIVLNILTNIFVMNGIKISQFSILELVSDRFEKEVLIIRSKRAGRSKYMGKTKDTLQVPGNFNPVRHRIYSSSMNYPESLEERSSDQEEVSSNSELQNGRDHLKNEKNIIFWREVILQIVDLLVIHSRDWMHGHLVKISHDPDSYREKSIREILERIFLENSGIYTSSETIWFGHLLKYGVTEVLGNVISFSIGGSELLEISLRKREENFETFQSLNPQVLARLKKRLRYLLQENVISMNLKIIRMMVDFNDSFSGFSRALFDQNFPAVGGGILSQDPLHSILESHIQFSWLLSQLFVWASMDVSLVLRDYLLSSIKEASLIHLAGVHPMILRNAAENLLRFRSFKKFELRVSSLFNSRPEWIDNLLRLIGQLEEKDSHIQEKPSPGKSLILKIINSDPDSIQQLGNFWKTFHPKYKDLQLAVYSVILHLFGVDDISNLDEKKKAVLEVSLNISKKCCSQLLSNWQAQSSSNGDENEDFQEHTRSREKFIEATIGRCRWIVDNIPFGLCNQFENSFIWETQIPEEKGKELKEQESLESRDPRQAVQGKYRRATDTNIIFNSNQSNSHHIDMLKQLLSIRRRSSQQNFDHPIVLSMSSLGSSSSFKFNRNNSDPSALSMRTRGSNANEKEREGEDWKLEKSCGIYGTGTREATSERSDVTSSQVLDIYIHFIMKGPTSIQDVNKVVKTEIFSLLLKLVTLEQIRKITSCHRYFGFSFQSYLRSEGWLYIRLAQLVMIHNFKFRSILELCLEEKCRDLALVGYCPPQDLTSNPFSGEGLQFMRGIVSNIQEWIDLVCSSRISLRSQFHQNITENDELWFDSALRLIILYLMVVSDKSSQDISVLNHISSCIFPFIENQDDDTHFGGTREQIVPVEAKMSLGDSVTGFLVAVVNSQDEKSLIRILQEQGYHIEQVIEENPESNTEELRDTRIFLFVQRLLSLPKYSVPIFANLYEFQPHKTLSFGTSSSILVFRPTKLNRDARSSKEDLSEDHSDSLCMDRAQLYFNLRIELEYPSQLQSKRIMETHESQVEGHVFTLHVCDADEVSALSNECGCYRIRLFSKKVGIKEISFGFLGGFDLQSKSRSNNKMENYFLPDGRGCSDFGEAQDLGERPEALFASSSSSLLSSSSSSIILLNSLNRINSMILNNSYVTRLRKRGWILFKTYLLTTLISTGTERSIKERIISYTFGILTVIANKIRDLRGQENSGDLQEVQSKRKAETIEELELYVEDVLNVLTYSVQLTCYSARLKSETLEGTAPFSPRGIAGKERPDFWGDISYSVLVRFFRLHNGEKHTLRDFWLGNSKIEARISVLLTECIRQCTLKDLTQPSGWSTPDLDPHKTQEWILQLKEITQNCKDKPKGLGVFSVALPSLHLFPTSFLKSISGELIKYFSDSQSSDLEAKKPPFDVEVPQEAPSSSPPPFLSSSIAGDPSPLGSSAGDVPPTFRDYPHSSIFIGAASNENFSVSIDGRIVQCEHAVLGGGIVICRAPLTFRGLQSTGLSVPPNILSFRVLGIGRFGITVAPSNVLAMSLEEVFQRNDVVGLRPQPPSSSSTLSGVYQLPENMFALEIPYIEGTVIDIRYGVSLNSTGSILRSEIFIGGESIGSVLEVQFNELAQISEDTRLSVIFVILDPLTIIYEGLPFSTRYRRRSSTWFESIQGGRVATQEQIQLAIGGGGSGGGPVSSEGQSGRHIDLKELDICGKRQLQNAHFIFYIQNIKLFQEILVSSHSLLSGLKENLIRSIHATFEAISRDFSTSLGSLFVITTSKETDRPDSIKLSSLDKQETEVVKQLDDLVEKTLLLCSVCTIFGVDLNSLEEQEGSVTPFKPPESDQMMSPAHTHSFWNSVGPHSERDLFLRRRCSNVAYGDLPWLTSSMDSGVLCYTSLFGLKLSQLELILEGFFVMFRVKFISQLYFLLGADSLKILLPQKQSNSQVLERQKLLLESLSVLVSRSSLVVSLISRVILELSPGNGSPELSEKLKNILFGFFSLISNFSLFSCGESLPKLAPKDSNQDPFLESSQDLFNLFSPQEKREISNSGLPESQDRKSLVKIIESTGIEFSSHRKGCEQGLETDLYLDSGLEEAEAILDLPRIQLKTILTSDDCNTFWKWIFSQKFVLGEQKELQPFRIRSIRHLDNSIYGKLSMNQRIFNLEGTNPLTAKKLVLKSNGTAASWSIKISAIDSLCSICGVLPTHITKLLFESAEKVEEVSKRLYQIIKVMRICTYFIIRGREDFVFPAAHQNLDDSNHLSPSPDYWLMYRRSICNDIHKNSEIQVKDSTKKILNRVDSESALTDKLYSWQRLMYILVSQISSLNIQDEKKEAIQKTISGFLKTEVIFHLMGSLIQIYSIRKKDVGQGGSNKQLKYSSLSPSVYVVHWFMDQFIRHPLCPSLIRLSVVNRFTWNFLFSLLTNGVHIPTKLAIDSCRMTYWITSRKKAEPSGVGFPGFQESSSSKQGDTELMDPDVLEQTQGILDSICFCVSCILSLYESKVNFDGDNPLLNVNNLPVYRELILGKVPITQLGWDHFTSAEDYKPANRQKINTTLICHFMACSARCILDSSDEYTLLPLPHILSFFNRYLNFISISNHLMLSTSDTLMQSNNEIQKLRSVEGSCFPKSQLYEEIFAEDVKPNTLFPWKYIQNTLNYINSKSFLLNLEENSVCQEYHSVLRINYGNSPENDLIEKNRKRAANQSSGSQGQNAANFQLSKLYKRNSGFIGFKIKPIKLDFDLKCNKVPRILYSINNNGINGLIHELGGYELGCRGEIQLMEAIKLQLEGASILSEERSPIGKDSFRAFFDSDSNSGSCSFCLRPNSLLYVNGTSSSTMKMRLGLSRVLGPSGKRPLRLILVGGVIFENSLSEREVSAFYQDWVHNELLQKLKSRKKDTKVRSQVLVGNRSYLGSILYSYYDDHCLTFGGDCISQSLTRIRAVSELSLNNRTNHRSFEISLVFQNRLFMVEVNGTPTAITGLPPQARFMLPVVYLEGCKDANGDLEAPIFCEIQLKNSLSEIFVPYTQITSKIEYLPIISRSPQDNCWDAECVKWIPRELRHRFREEQDPEKTPNGDGPEAFISKHLRLKVHSKLIQNSLSGDMASSKSDLSVLGSIFPKIPSGISFCSSSNTSRDLYSPALLNSWGSWVLPESSPWTLKKVQDEYQPPTSNDDECYLNDNGDTRITSRLFKSLDPCKSFRVEFKIERFREGGVPSHQTPGSEAVGRSQVFGIGIDWLDGIYRYAWLSDGRFVVSSLPPFPYEISKLYKEYKIPSNWEITFHNLGDLEGFAKTGSQDLESSNMISIPKFGVHDEIAMEFQPNIPALIFFKNGKYSFSLNFTEFYRRFTNPDLEVLLSSQCKRMSLPDETGFQLEPQLMERQIWIVRNLFVMAILQGDVMAMHFIVSRYGNYIIDFEKKEFLFKLLITEDLYNNILNCIPKSISDSRLSIRSLLNNIYDYVKFPNPREFCSENQSGLDWNLLDKVFSVSLQEPIRAENSSWKTLKVFSEKRPFKVIKHETPFWLACWIGSEEIIRYLLKYVHVDNRGLNLLSQDFHSSLYIGCFSFFPEAERNLTTETGFSSSSTPEGTRFVIQIEERRTCPGERVLEKRGNPLFQTGLMASIISGNTRIAYILMVVYDSDVNIQDKQGNTSYHFALAFGHLDILQLLSYKGVNPYIMNNNEQFAGSLYRNILRKFLEREKSQGLPGDFLTEVSSPEQSGLASPSTSVPGPGSSRLCEWGMNPNPPSISYHGEREDIAEFTQQYEKLYCFSVSNSQGSGEREAHKSFVNMNIQNKSNLLPPFQYPWPGLFSDCQVVAFVDNSHQLDRDPGVLESDLSEKEDSISTSPDTSNHLKKRSKLTEKLYDEKRINIHIIQYLFYRWIRSIRCYSVPSSVGNINSGSIVNMSITRKPDSGRPTDDFVYNVNSINYYQFLQPTSSGLPSNTPRNYDHSSVGIPASSSSTSQNYPSVSGDPGRLSPGIQSGYRVSQRRERGVPVSNDQASAPELQIPALLQGGIPGVVSRPPRIYNRTNGGSGSYLMSGESSGISASAPNKVLVTQEVMEEIYNGLSQIRDVRELLDVIHTMYKYLLQVSALRSTTGGMSTYLSTPEIPFPKNAGVSGESREMGSEKQGYGEENTRSFRTDEPQLQEQMVRSCWELLEMEEVVDKVQGYYPYWTAEHERFIWIHNIRKLLTLVNNNYNNLDYISCNSWIEWIPNLDLFDKTLFNRHKKSLSGSTNEKLLRDNQNEAPRLDFQCLARPIVSLDTKILYRMHQHCQTSVDHRLIQLLNIELNEQQIYRVILFELLSQLSFREKPEFELKPGIESENEGKQLNSEEIRNKTLALLGIKSLEISKMIPKPESGVWNRAKISPSDSLDMIRSLSNSIKNLFVLVILRYCFNRVDESILLGRSDLELEKEVETSSGSFPDFEKDDFQDNNFDSFKTPLIDQNTVFYENSEFPFRIIEILLGKVLPIYTTSLDVFTKIQLSNTGPSGKNLVKVKLQSFFWYVDILKQFLLGRVLLLNKFNDISRFTIPMISGVFNSPTLNYEQEDFLRISSAFYFSNNFFGDLFWNHQNLKDFNGYFSIEKREVSGTTSCIRSPEPKAFTLPLLLLQSSKLLGSWGSYFNIYSSPRYLIHVGPYDIPIPISSYLLLKPFFKLSLVNSLWSDILKKLIDSKKRDGNSTANNGLTVHLNRNLAVTGGNPLKYSLLSQSTRQILQMLPEKLRITERPFLIVFRGEGSTDFGGPFQEFLSWISNEIMSKTNDKIEKMGISPIQGKTEMGMRSQVEPLTGPEESQYLGLFSPCANALHSIGHNQDTVSINSIHSGYKTPNSLYTCEEFLLFGPMPHEGNEKSRKNLLSWGSLLEKFKVDFYKRRGNLNEPIQYDKEEPCKGFQRFKFIISKVPSLRCYHNYSGNSKILTHTIESRIQSFFTEIEEEAREKEKLKQKERERERARQRVEVEPELELEEENLGLDGSQRISQVPLQRTESNHALEGISSRLDSSWSSSSESLSTSLTMGSIPEELNPSESVNNTNPTPITAVPESGQPNQLDEEMGIMHKLDPWEWPKEKTMKEIINEMYECLGRLMGICVTTKSAMNINLNPLLWKKFSGLPLSLKDLMDADCIAYEMLNSLKSIENENLNTKGNNEPFLSSSHFTKAFEGSIIPEIEGLTFQIENMNGSITSLLDINEGELESGIGVNLENLHLFVQLAERCRMLDDTEVMNSILKGFGTIIPLGRMRMLFSHQKIEYLICGESKIDLEVLKNHTVSPHPELKEQLFQVLETFNNEQLQKLLRFVSGRSRLPQINNNSSDWKFSINYDNPDSIQDNRLPIATTCGFRLSLPRYSSIEILRSRLLYAINNCVAIDLDAYVTHDN
ncbi:hect-domain (ubiquitin-transferase) domain-containing protein [Cryptosporidium felis]|nr:hect-domain (ubiquitin-transferase) domain-containing protein [Cryptosporidium felis]